MHGEGGQAQPEREEIVVRREIAAGLNGALSIPSETEFRIVLSQKEGAAALHDLRTIVATWQAVAAKCKQAFEDTVKLAVYRLEVERALGAELAQTVRRGGDRSKYSGSTLLSESALPPGISKNQSAAYQRLAAIPDATFRAYVTAAKEKRRVPSASAAKKFAAQGGTPRASAKRPRRRAVASAAVLSPAVVDAISRIVDPDVVVGTDELDAVQRVPANAKDVFDHLRGNVVIAACPDPSTWLPQLEQMRAAACFKQALVVLPAQVWSDWFAVLQGSAWSCCFVRGVRNAQDVGQLIAHLGEKPAAFEVVAHEIGVLWSHRS